MMDDKRVVFVCVHVCVQEDFPCIILSDMLPAVRKQGMMTDRGKRSTICMLSNMHTHASNFNITPLGHCN